MSQGMTRHRVVIVGGGFAGLNAARGLGRAPVEVTLIDRRNFHLFQPLLYQVATGGLSPADLCAPLREVLKRQRNTTVLLSEVTGFDLAAQEVFTDQGVVVYDTLIVAVGARHHYFGQPWEPFAPGLKDVEDATEIRSRILTAFESAELTDDLDERRRLLTFVLVGAGPTGVELAGAIGELARHTLRHEFRRFAPAEAHVVLVEGADRVLPVYPAELSKKALRVLERLGVDVRLGTRVESVDAGGVELLAGDQRTRLESATVLWAAGVQASPLAGLLAQAAGAETDRAGRILASERLTIPERPEVFVLGDMVALTDEDGQPLPGIAPVAMQQGRYAARAIRRRLGDKKVSPFRYVNKGSLAVIGRAAAVADLGFVRFSGYPAWLLWLFVHIMYLVGYTNRALVFVQWAYSYFTRGRGARIIANASTEDVSTEPRA